MSSFLPFVVIGITTGSVYGLVGTGLVLTYKTTNVFNFAYGSLAALAAFVFYFLRQQHHVPWPLAALVACGLLGVVLGVVLERLGREIVAASTQVKVVTTVGLLLIVLSLGAIWYPGPVRAVEPFLPTSTIVVASVHVTWSQIITLLFALAATTTLYLFFRLTRIGTAMRAVVDNADLLSRTGENPVRIRRYAWIIGALLVTASGLLLAPSVNLDAETLTLLVVQAFGAAAIGGFSNLPLTFGGGIVLGVMTALATKYAATSNNILLDNAGTALPFLVLFFVLVLTPPRRLREGYFKPTVKVLRSWQAPPMARIWAGAVAIGVLITVPKWAGVRLPSFSNFLVTAILLLALGLLVRMSGQISLCQVTFAAIGATTMSHLTVSFHLPWLVALVLSVLIVIPPALLIAVPAIRLSGVFLALATLGFGIIVEQAFFPLQILFGTKGYGVTLPRPAGGIGPWHFGTDKGYYWVLLCFLIGVVAIIESIASGRLGRLLAAMGDSPVVLETNGTTVAITRVMVFCISAGLAALSGALGGVLFGFAEGAQYQAFSSLTMYVLVIITFAGSPWYGILAAAFYSLGPSYIDVPHINAYLQLAFGIGAATYVFAARRPPAVPKALRQYIERRFRPVEEADDAIEHAEGYDHGKRSETPTVVSKREPAAVDGSSVGLVISDVTIRYGGVTAVSGLDLEARIGRITGLIGPNGAGKTTMFNACSGLLRASSGTITFRGQDITRASPHRRAQLGIGRTFQQAVLLDSLSVVENVEIGLEASYANGTPWAQMRSGSGQRSHTRSAAEQAMKTTGLWQIRHTQAGLLPTGPRRLVEVARVLAAEFDLLLLDEPCSGLDSRETRELGEILRNVVDKQGRGILLVEHDMSLVRQICDYVYVVDFGNKIFEGSVEGMQRSEPVRTAYLGSDYDSRTGAHERR